MPRGHVFVSVKYRLSPAVRHPAHVEDVAAALAWTKREVGAWGGDPGRLFVMGHSAGPHLAALVATDARRLEAVSLAPGDLAGLVCLDTAAYDLEWRLGPEGGSRARTRAMLEDAFGAEPAGWRDASPVAHVAAGAGIAPFLLIHVGRRPDSAEASRRLAEALDAAGVPVAVLHAPDRDHGAINARLGAPGDRYTAVVDAFLADPAAAADLEVPPADEDEDGAGDARAERRAETFARLDADGDEQVSRAEYEVSGLGARVPGLFDRLDRDGDGGLSRDEVLRR